MIYISVKLINDSKVTEKKQSQKEYINKLRQRETYQWKSEVAYFSKLTAWKRESGVETIFLDGTALVNFVNGQLLKHLLERKNGQTVCIAPIEEDTRRRFHN